MLCGRASADAADGRQADSLDAYSADGHAQLVLPLLTAAHNREDVRLFPGLVDKVKLLSEALETNGGARTSLVLGTTRRALESLADPPMSHCFAPQCFSSGWHMTADSTAFLLADGWPRRPPLAPLSRQPR